MRIDLNVDDAQLLRRLRKGEKRFIYAVVNGLNETAKVIQKAEQAHVRDRFTVRKQFTIRQAAVIKPFANVRAGRPYVEISVGGTGRVFLSRFEEGGPRPSASGKPGVAVPIIGGPARPTFKQAVRPSLHFKELAFTRDPRTGQMKGRRRTFILTQTAKAPKGGIFQRVGPSRDDIRMVYSFGSGQRVDGRLDFVRTADRVTRRVFRTILRSFVAKELARS